MHTICTQIGPCLCHAGPAAAARRHVDLQGHRSRSAVSSFCPPNSVLTACRTEFPQIRIDYFRHQPAHTAPLACFLSHVHSDHLVGLESLRAPFVYCSAATREILLRLEKYHYRANFARGILEARNVTYQKSMHRLAKSLPLETPIVIELAPGNNIRVTLFDANHCVGAVMFLIEGQGKAIPYTGDIRAEAWWVNSIVQNPILLPYAVGRRRLDCMYLDTTFATKSQPYREFPSKAEGIRELLSKMDEHPKDTVFYFHSWTFGYEQVWIAVSAYLGSQIHVDLYQKGIYDSLSPLMNKHLTETGLHIPEAPPLCGFRNGNHVQPGCLTSDPNVRLHSCERGMGCPVVDHSHDANVVHIIPIVTRSGNTEVAELGAGGGKGDLDQKEILETGSADVVGNLMALCASTIQDEQLLSKVLQMLQDALDRGDGNIDLGTDMLKESQGSEDELSLQNVVSALSANATKSAADDSNKAIRFPYSRHSSYSELCRLVDAFRPHDVFPCTVDDERWTPELGMRHLFGEYCSGDTFRHDSDMMEAYEARLKSQHADKRGRETSRTQSQDSTEPSPRKNRCLNVSTLGALASRDGERVSDKGIPFSRGFDRTISVPLPTPGLFEKAWGKSPKSNRKHMTTSPTLDEAGRERSSTPPTVAQGSRVVPKHDTIQPSSAGGPGTTSREGINPTPSGFWPSRSTTTAESMSSRRNRELAYKAASGLGLTWADYGGLVCTRKKEDREEMEL
ncbi:hypothetical protein EJ04DRAFT_488540 [Polyplosphaeria fusca]|uniref:Protein artemis n=1 Tax=Polyplosphaeria fusca TaxID=682080 RepID=A0A9P4V284_9PLEO|nr:hypothetical protein EJ04DRAFT_488540 [Polyplosphaeria fusca]